MVGVGDEALEVARHLPLVLVRGVLCIETNLRPVLDDSQCQVFVQLTFPPPLLWLARSSLFGRFQ